MRSFGNLRFVSAIILAAMFVIPSALSIGTADLEPRLKVLVYTDSAQTVKDLKSSGAIVLEEYGSFALVSGTTKQLEGFKVMDTQYNMDTVDLLQYVIDHRQGEPTLPDGLSLDTCGNPCHYIVQYYGPIKQTWKDELTSKGAIIDEYLPSNAYIVKMTKELRDEVAKDPKVQYVGLYQPAYKIQGGLLKESGPITVQAIIFNDADAAATLNAIQQFGQLTFVSNGQSLLVGIGLDASDVPNLARMDAIKWIELKGVWVPYTSTATWIVQSGVQDSTPMYDHGIHGENQTVFLSDTGIWVSHEAFFDASHSVQYSAPAANTGPDANHRKIVNYWTFADNLDSDNMQTHGTHTDGVTAGDSTPNGGAFKGIAYAAKISFGDIWYNSGADGIPNDLNNLFIKGFNDGARVSSNSWGLYGSHGIYDAQSQQADNFMWNHKEFQIDFAAGNDGPSVGSVSTPATAKSVLAIGAAEHDNNGDMVEYATMDYSSRGPTQDGRIKPEIYVPTNENGPCGGDPWHPCSNTAYNAAGGTSNACPTATGGMALIRQYYTDGFYPTGTKTSSDAFNPTSALMRASVVNGAIEKNGQHSHTNAYNSWAWPNNDQGFGYMDIHNSLVFQGDAKKLYADDHTVGLSTGQTVEYYFDVVDTSMPFKATLAWTDYPGTPGAGTELVNNLDMTIEGPGGSYKGNVFKTSGSPHESTTGGVADAKNTIEQFFLSVPTPGGYTIKITATNIAQDTQPFALVVNGNYVRDPDLALLKSELTVSSQTITEGDHVLFNGTVHNYGGLVVVPVPMTIKVDDVEVSNTNLDFTLTDRKTFSYEWVAAAGNHKFQFAVDPLHAIHEADENNNMVNITLWANGLPHANMSLGPDSPYTLQFVYANSTNSTDDGPIAWYRFDFGDGYKTQWQKGQTAAHSYKNDGTYNVTAWVKDNMSAISAPDMKQVVVLNRAPIANASAAVLQTYTYVDVSLNGVRSTDLDGKITLLWDFGDGATSTDPKPVHNWTDNGVYNVTLKVTDDDGATNTATLKMTILDQAPTAYFSANIYRGNVTTPFQFNASGSDRDGSIAKWVWDFGDGNKSSEKNPMHHYGNDGSYNVSFYVEDNDGSRSSVLNKTIIIDNLPPEANFTVDKLTAYTYEDITFKDLSSDLDGRIVTLNWDLGDGKMFKNSTLVHQYKENGVFTVKLTVQDDDDALATKEVQITIKNRAPVAKAMFNQTAIVGDLVILTANQSTDMDGTIKFYTWTFNGTERHMGQTITYAFWEVGVHNFTLSVQDNDGATNTTTLSITILKKPSPPKPSIISGSMDPFTLLLIIILIGCVVGAVIGAVYYSKKNAKHKGHPGAEKVATVPLTTTMDIDNASAGKSVASEQKFESAYQYQAYGKVEAYPFYGKEIETVAPAYDYGPGYDQTGSAEPETTATKEVEAQPAEEEPPQAPVEEPEEEEIPIKPVIVEHDAVATKVAEPDKEPEPKPDDAAKKAKEKEIKEANDLDEILGLLNDK